MEEEDEIRGSDGGQAGADKTRETKSARFHQPRQQSQCKECKQSSRNISDYIKQMGLKITSASPRELYCGYGKPPQKLTSLLSSLSHTLNLPRDWHIVESRFHSLGTSPSWYHRTLIHLWSNAYQTNRLGSSETTTAEELAEILASAWPGTSGHSLKSQLSILLVMEQFLKVAKSVMFRALKIEQKFPQKHTIMDD